MFGEEYNEMTEARLNTYGFLSGLCLRPPSETMISMVKNGNIMESVQVDPESKAYHQLLALTKTAAVDPDLEINLEAEHTALFMMPGDVMPHEAVYLDKEQKLGGRITISVQEFYICAGATIREDSIHLPDHIGMELEFMEFLCNVELQCRQKSESDTLKKCIEFQQEFLNNHLLKWGVQCSQDILSTTNNHLYAALAHLIIEFLEEEAEYVDTLYRKANSDTRVT
jgi:TorA maturation chaperone TorD